MSVTALVCGALSTNSFILWSGESSFCWIFDVPDDPVVILEFLTLKKLKPEKIFLTHAHCDHIAGLAVLRKEFPDVVVYQHEAEKDWLSDAQMNLSLWMGQALTLEPCQVLLKEGDLLEGPLGNFVVWHTPGHSPGSVCYYNEEQGYLIGGDLLFRGSVGRWDFPGSDYEAIKASVTRVLTLPEATLVYPGHGPDTTIKRERHNQVFLN